ncbi:hypothetical protein GCM10028798_10820 [Humibacter antri]
MHVAGSLTLVRDVGFCAGVACTPHRLSIKVEGSTPTPIPIAHQGNVWTVPSGSSRPAHGRVAAFDSSGDILANDVVALSWKNDGTSTCPGPYTATANLHIPL